MNLSEAFRALNALNEDTFSVSDDGISKLAQFQENDDLEDEIKVIDPDAETEEDLEDSYVGKVILDCSVCHSKLYKDKEEVVVNDEGTLANVDEECPFCYTVEGFKVIGEVAEFGGNSEPTQESVEEEEPLKDSDDDDDESLDEGIFGFGKKKKEAERKREEQRKAREAERERANQAEAERQAEVVRGWKEREERERQAKAEYQRSRYNGIKGSTLSNTGYSGINYSGGDYYSEGLDSNKDDSVNSVNVETDDSVVNVSTEESGKVTVTTEPANSTSSEGDEVIVPVSPETEEEIEGTEDEESVDAEIEEFDEESFDELGESYLKKIYENVDSYKTTDVFSGESSIKVEGVIRFTSGKQKKTSFIFEAKDCTRSGKFRFIGENAQINKGSKSFILNGKVEGNKFITESLNYNYGVKDSKGNSSTVFGTVRR